MTLLSEALRRILDLGGPVVMVLLAMSVLALAVTLYKLWQYRANGVGRHKLLQEALILWDGGDAPGARRRASQSRSCLAPVVARAMSAPPDATPDSDRRAERLDAEAGTALTRLESGFRMLDSIAQIAPLLGLFGTVLGMIDAFQALQEAGSSVDPALLAGGIWVALLTTAVGLAVAMPTSLILTWFESRMARERGFADLALRRVLDPRAADHGA